MDAIDLDADSPQLLLTLPPSQRVRCPQCTLLNPPNAPACTACSKHFVDHKACPRCTANNVASAPTCTVCEHPLTPAVAASAAASAAAAITTNRDTAVAAPPSACPPPPPPSRIEAYSVAAIGERLDAYHARLCCVDARLPKQKCRWDCGYVNAASILGACRAGRRSPKVYVLPTAHFTLRNAHCPHCRADFGRRPRPWRRRLRRLPPSARPPTALAHARRRRRRSSLSDSALGDRRLEGGSLRS